MVVKSVNVKLMIILWASFLPLISSHRRPFWTKAPVCEAYNLPVNAEWIPRTSCDDNKKFQCAPGHETTVQTICKNGHWSLEVTCKNNVAKTCAANQTLSPSSNEVTPSGVYQDTYDFKCLPEYTKNNDTGTVFCNAMGKWEFTKKCEDCFIRNTRINIAYVVDVTPQTSCADRCKSDTSCKTSEFIQSKNECYLFRDNSRLDSFESDFERCVDYCMDNKKCVTMQYLSDDYVCLLLTENIDTYKNRGLKVTNQESDTVFEKNTCPSFYYNAI